MPTLDIELNHKQTEFIQAIFDENWNLKDNQYDEFAFWGGYASGKTMCVLLAIHLLCSRYPNIGCTMIRETYSQLDDTVISDFNKMFHQIGYHHKDAKKEIHYPNGSVIRFRAFDKPEKILGGNIDIIVVSQAEQIPEDLFKQLFGRQRGSSSLPRKILITEGNPSECWAKVRYNDNPIPNNVKYVHATTFDNEKFLTKNDPKFIPNLLANLTETQVKRMMYAEWSGHDEMVFPSFNEAISLIDPISFYDVHKNYKILAGGDYGIKNPSAFIWAFKDFDGNIIVFDEFYETYQSYDQLAEAGKRYGKHSIIYDYATKIQYEVGKSTWNELEKRGLNLIEANKDEKRNISITNTLFRQSQLFITRNCTNLINEIRNYRWKKRRLGLDGTFREQPVDKDNHAVDSLLYLISFMEDVKSKDPTVLDITKTIFYQATRRDKTKVENYG